MTGTSNTGVNWLVGGVPGGSSTLGSINSSGLYTAPSTVPATSTVMVTANSIQDPTASASASVDITAATINPVAVSIAPTSASLQAGQTKQFSATVSGTTNIGVNWLVNGTLGGSSSVGTIDSTGYYRAPSTLSLNLTVTITATSVVDTSKSANATVNLTAPAAISPVGQYYVSPTGSDSNSGTQAAPFLTIQRAADVVNPGDTVIVEDGVYSNSAASGNNSRLVTMSRGGTAASPVTFRAQNKWGAVLDGLNNTTADGMGVAANYITIQDFEIRNFGNGVSGGGLGIENDSGGTNLSILGNNIHDIGRMCTDTSNGEVGIFLANDSVTVSGNLIHDIGRFAPGENGCQPSTGYYQNHDHGIYIALGSHYKIQNNIFYANRRGWAIQLYPSALDDVQIVNNTFADPNPYRDGHIVITPSAITNSLIANNIFYQPTNAALYCGASGPNSLTVENNLTTVSQMCNASMSGTSFSNNLVSQSSSGLMVDPSNHNYHLATGSPAIDAGTSTNAPSTDYDGISRPQGAGYDIGAYEWR